MAKKQVAKRHDPDKHSDPKKKPEPQAKSAVAPASKKPTKEQKAELIEEKLAELSIAVREFKESQAEWASAHAEAAAAKKEMELAQSRVNSINTDLCDIRAGNFNLRLPFPPDDKKKAKGDKTAGQDPAVTFPLDKLTEFGLTSNAVEKLLTGTTCRTIGDLERTMRDDAYWHQKIAGYGEDKVNKLVDALLALRQKHPHPEPKVEASDKAEEPKPETPDSSDIDDGNTVFDMPAPRLPVVESNGEASLK